jgi:putative tryptophan/tyrosine transport system substrate-binding protein
MLRAEGFKRNYMKRRQFITFIGSAVIVVPLGTHAEQPAVSVIGFLSSRSANDSVRQVDAFRGALREAGFIEGQDIAIDYSWADGQYDRLPRQAADLVGRRVAVIFAAGPAVHAAKAATTVIPIVFVTGEDPINFGLVASLNKPGGNITGVSTFNAVLGSKRFEFLHELVPNAAMIGLLVNPNFPSAASETNEMHALASAAGRKLIVLNASTESEIDAAFATIAQQRVNELFVTGDPFFVSRRGKIVELAARHSVPTMYVQREFAAAGGLICYGTSLTDAYRQAGSYAGRILRGARPADLPVLQPTKFELVVNLRTATALGLTVPPLLLAGADELIE